MHLCAHCNTPVPGSRCPHCTGRRFLAAGPVALLGLTLAACGPGGFAQAEYGAIVTLEDVDEDGYNTSEDCDDTNPDIHPGAEETAGDGVDSNCDGEDDPQA